MDLANDKNQNDVTVLAKISETAKWWACCVSRAICCSVFRNHFFFNSTMEELLEEEYPKNPLLFFPVIRCIFGFLNVKDIKSCRLVCHEWGSSGKLALANCALIHFHRQKTLRQNYELPRLPDDFQSCFLDSASLFSAFKISCFLTKESFNDLWMIEEITKYFEQQKYLRELILKLEYPDMAIVENFNLSSRISNSFIVKKFARNLKKLSIEGDCRKPLDISPIHLIAHIQHLTLSNVRINLETEIQICSTKVKLENVMFFQDGIALDAVLINDIVNFRKAKEVSLECGKVANRKYTKYVVDLGGNATLDNLTLEGACEIVHWESSHWATEHFATIYIPYSLNSQMKIKELYLHMPGPIDLFTLPDSIQKLTLSGINNYTTLSCSEPIFLENLQYLCILEYHWYETDCSYLSHFMNCPQLTHLKLYLYTEKELNSLWMPKSVKTLTLGKTIINWVDYSSYLNLEKLVFPFLPKIDEAKKLFQAKIQVKDLVVFFRDLKINKHLIKFLDTRKRYSFGKRLYIGELDWEMKELKYSALKKHVDVKSSFYVFENGEKGRAFSKEDFHELMPRHIDIEFLKFL